MKKNKKMLLSAISLMLALTMVLSGIITSAEETTPVITADVENRVALLDAMKISKYGGVGVTEWTGDLTRGEAAFLVAGLVQLDRTKKESIFNDVSTEAYYAGSVASLQEESIIIKEWGSMKYKPDEPITYADFVIMICRALGYTGYAESKGGYPMGYLSVAKQFKITKGIAPLQGNIDKTLVPEIIMNALHAYYLGVTSVDSYGNIDTVKKGIVLEDYFEMKTFEGIVEEVGYFTMTNNFQATEGRINVGGINFYLEVAPNDFEKYVGQYATVYYTGERTAVQVYPTSENTVTTLNAEVLLPYTGGANYVNYYDENDKKQKIELELGYTTMYNGVKVPTFTVPTYGTVTFIDNDDDGAVEVIKVREYKLGEISGFNTIDNTVTIKEVGGVSTVTIDGNNTNSFKIRLAKNGKVAKLSSFALGSKVIYSVSAPRSVSNQYCDIVLLNSTVEGKIAGLTADEITIGTTNYKVGGIFNLGSAVIGNSATAYLDLEGRVVCLDAQAYNYKDMKYAVITDIDQIKGGANPQWEIEMFTQDNKLSVFTIADEVKINGTKKDMTSATTRTEIESLITPDETHITLVKYKLKENKLYELLYVTGDNDWGSTLKPWLYGAGFNKFSPSGDLRWRTTGGGQFDSSIFLAADALRVHIKFYKGKFDPEYSQFTSMRLPHDKNVIISLYDIDKNGFPHAYIVTSSVDKDNLKSRTDSTNNARLIGVTKVLDGIDSKGDPCKYIYGIMEGMEVQYYVTREDYDANGALRDALQVGNLAKIRTQPGNKIIDISEQIFGGRKVYYTKNELTNPVFSKDAPGYYAVNAAWRVDRNSYLVTAKVISIDNGYVTFTYKPNVQAALTGGTDAIFKLPVQGSVTKFAPDEDVSFIPADWKDIRTSTNVDAASLADPAAVLDGSTVIFNVGSVAITEVFILD